MNETLYKRIEFTDDEFIRRHSLLESLIQEQELDVLVLFSPENVTWGCGFKTIGHPLEALIVTADNRRPIFITRLLESNNFDACGWASGVDVTDWSDTDDKHSMIGELIRSRIQSGCSRIGFEENSSRASAKDQRLIKETLPGEIFVPIDDAVERIRTVKSEQEIEYMSRAALCTGRGIRNAVTSSVPGKTEHDVFVECSRGIMSESGSRWPSYMPFITTGPHSQRGHASTEGRPIYGLTYMKDGTTRPGQLVFYEVGASYKGYHCPNMRVLYISEDGKLPLWLQEAEELLVRAVDSVLEKLKPGMTGAELDKISRDILNTRTFEATMNGISGYSVGAGQGADWSDGSLRFIGTETRTVSENMTFHIIPWLQTPLGSLGLSCVGICRKWGGEEIITGIPRKIQTLAHPQFGGSTS